MPNSKAYKYILEGALWLSLSIFYYLSGSIHSQEFAIISMLVITTMQLLLVKFNQNYLFDKYYDSRNLRPLIIRAFSLIFMLSITNAFIEHQFYFHDNERFKTIGNMKYIMPIIWYSLNLGLAFFVSTSILISQKEKENALRIKDLEKNKIDTELKFLKAQINPHFLFNALNNIYTISYKGRSEAPDKILELADMLRYVLYEAKNEQTKLKTEIQYLENFIKFQQLKTAKEQNIKLKLNLKNENISIAPMILIPFVENSFKHSKVDTDPNAFVSILLDDTDDELLFSIENSIPQIAPAKMFEKSNGIGLENVKKRLELIYSKHYNLKINSENKVFSVKLRIKKNER